MDNNQQHKIIFHSRIEDTICLIGNNAKLKINIGLYKTQYKNNEREFYLKEVYYFNKDNIPSKKLRRNLTEVYLSLENINYKENKEYIIISGRELEYMKIYLIPKLEEMVANRNDIFEIRKDGKLYIKDNRILEFKGLSDSYALWFQPSIYKKYNDELVPAMDMYINSQYTKTTILYPMVYEFIYIIKTIQLQNYAASVLPSLSMPTKEEMEMTELIDIYNNEYPNNNNKSSSGFFVKQLEEKRKKNEEES